MSNEHIIISNLIYNTEYCTKVLPFIKEEYFQDRPIYWTFKILRDYVNKYINSPTRDILLTELGNRHDIGENECRETAAFIKEQLKETPQQDLTWLVDITEKWCQHRAIFNATFASIEILENKNDDKERISIPVLLQDALNVSFQRRTNMNLATMLKNYVAPDYLIEDLFKRGYVYSLTGLTGSGKTVVALFLAMQVARNANIGERAVKGGRVAYFAGENPDDVTQRLMVMTDGLDLDTIPLTVMPYAGREKAEIAIAELIHDRQEIALVIIDTSTAYFAGEDENDNKAALEHAKWLRSISKRIPGNPTILVCCHPIKNAQEDNMLPRGGGAFVNEMDGNLACIKKDELTVVSQHGKYRDIYFHPINFLRSVKQSERLKTASGKMIWSVICHLATPQEEAEHEFEMNNQDRQVLELLAGNATISLRTIANRLFWFLSSGEPNPEKVRRVIKRLQKNELIDKNNILTELGRSRFDEQQAKKPNGGAQSSFAKLFAQ